jgi:hypothetical protein
MVPRMKTAPAFSALVLLALWSPGCGRSTPLEGEGPEELRECSAPLASVPLDRERSPGSGAILHWDMTPGCIAVTYDQSLEELRPVLEKGLAAWSAPECTSLCFSELAQSSLLPASKRDRRWHFTTDAASKVALSPLQVTLNITTFEDSSGTVFNQALIFRNGTLTERTLGEILSQVGRGLGFQASNGLDSTIQMEAGSTRTLLTEADQKSVCGQYPATEQCQ